MSIHPFNGLGLSEDRRKGFWEDYSGCYSSMHQGDMPDRIVDWMESEGIIGSGRTILEIGSGPGTYSLRLAQHSDKIICLDSSPGMLARLSSSAESLGLDNTVHLLADWNTFVPEEKVDLCISTLAPTSSPESLMRMESCSKDWCASVFWVRNEGDELTARIWKALGKDFGFDERSRSPAYEWLNGNGRSPRMEIFETHVSERVPLASIVEKEAVAFRAYGVDEDIGSIVVDLLSDVTEGDEVVIEEDNSLRVVLWKSQ